MASLSIETNSLHEAESDSPRPESPTRVPPLPPSNEDSVVDTDEDMDDVQSVVSDRFMLNTEGRKGHGVVPHSESNPVGVVGGPHKPHRSSSKPKKPAQ